MRAVALALCAASGSSGCLRRQPFPPPPIASYQISCRLDAEKKTLEGTRGPDLEEHDVAAGADAPLPPLPERLPQHALDLLAGVAAARAATARLPDSWGSIEITRMTGIRRRRPAAGAAPTSLPTTATRTTARSPRSSCPAPSLRARRSRSRSTSRLAPAPRLACAPGYKGDFFIVVQWFPKIGVLEENGWNCHQFHAWSEFFSDFGNYDVSIDVPAALQGKVGATGEHVEERETSAGRMLYRFRQDGVHDFAWTADPSYLVLEDTFREAGLGDVRLLLFSSPSTPARPSATSAPPRRRSPATAASSGAYPYATLTIVDPPWGARGAGGMEYPTLITGGTSWSAPASVHRPRA